MREKEEEEEEGEREGEGGEGMDNHIYKTTSCLRLGNFKLYFFKDQETN